MLKKLDKLRLLGYGGLVGGGVSGLIFLGTKEVLSSSLTLDQFILVGVLIGGGLHQFVDRALIRGVLLPCAKFFGFYANVTQLVLIRKLIGLKLQREILRRLARQYFLGEENAKSSASGTRERGFKNKEPIVPKQRKRDRKTPDG